MASETWTLTAPDGLQLHATDWRPQGQPKAMIALVHGLGSPAAPCSCTGGIERRGCVVAGSDQRGFGRSQGQRGHTPSLQACLDDIAAFPTQLSRRHPGLPQVLRGHSRGAVLSLAFVATGRPLAGVIAKLSGPEQPGG